MLTEEQRTAMRGTLTREESMALVTSEWWKDMTTRDIAEFQLGQRRLCMPFEFFQLAVEDALGRGVLTHEFAQPDALLSELREARS